MTTTATAAAAPTRPQRLDALVASGIARELASGLLDAREALERGATTNEALAAGGLTKRWTGPTGKTCEVMLDGVVVFTGGSWGVTCWLLGGEPEAAR